jgi:hypothetical protein
MNIESGQTWKEMTKNSNLVRTKIKTMEMRNTFKANDVIESNAENDRIKISDEEELNKILDEQ